MRVFDREKLERMEKYIHDYMQRSNGTVPKLSEIMEYMDMSKATAYRYIMKLNDEGKVEYNGKGTMKPAEPSNYTRKYSSIKVPIYGSVICGTPEEEEQHNEGYLAIPEEWVDGECFLLKAKGDSMVDIGVNQGDLVLVKKPITAPAGQVVVALTENGNTLKRLAYENGKPILLAENSTYSEKERVIRPKQLAIQGIALKIIKDIK